MPPPSPAAAGQLNLTLLFFPVLSQPYSWVVKALPDTAGLHLLQLGRESKPLPGSLF